jgi:[pyruvate, water dikinase]-phosphate phosphotransferase / [pyruvate, water dikinase] kinase
MKKMHLHLVSDSTGDTVRNVARACMVQFEDVEATEHSWVLVRSRVQLDRVVQGIEAHPGIVLCTILDDKLRRLLEDACRRLQMPCISVLTPVLNMLSNYFGSQSRGQPGRQHAMDQHYHARIEAMDFIMNHDDGQSLWNIQAADIVLVGVSRTSKTPTSIYLANRGYKTANVPLVPGIDPPTELETLQHALIVGLTVDAQRLVQIRRNRLLTLKEERETSYVDAEQVAHELQQARRYFSRHNWPVIDVTRRSVEETAAAILQLLEQRREANG